MSLGHGTKLLREGLVFAYDAANTRKSWKGAPFKNELLSDVSWGGDGGSQSGFTKGNTVITDNSLKYEGLKTCLWAPGTGRNVYLNGSAELDFTSVSTEWTFSCYVKREDGLAITSLNVYMYYPNGDGASSGTITDVGNGWYKVSRTRTGSSNYISLVGFSGFSSNVKYYLSGPMLTKTQFAVYPTAAQVTRSNTEALLDISGDNNSINTSSLSYLTDGSFDFNSSLINTGLFSARNTDASPFTVEAWVKSDATSGARMWVDVGGNGSSQRFYSSLLHPQAGNPLGVQATGWGTSVPYDTEWHHQAIVVQGGIVRGYSDGVEVHQRPYTAYTLPGDIIIGGRSGYYWDGKIDLVRIYEVDLTPAQIKQNYEATKGRFQ